MSIDNTTKLVDFMLYNVYIYSMKYFDWSEEKNQWLVINRSISFEFIKECIEKA